MRRGSGGAKARALSGQVDARSGVELAKDRRTVWRGIAARAVSARVGYGTRVTEQGGGRHRSASEAVSDRATAAVGRLLGGIDGLEFTQAVGVLA